ncbi:unnamed protein product, partial [Didymodactylos carnosus]
LNGQFGYLSTKQAALISAGLNSIGRGCSNVIVSSSNISRLTCSRCQLSSMMNSRETIMTDAATNTSSHEDELDTPERGTLLRTFPYQYKSVRQMSSNNNYHFEPIDNDISNAFNTATATATTTTTLASSKTHLIKPVPYVRKPPHNANYNGSNRQLLTSNAITTTKRPYSYAHLENLSRNLSSEQVNHGTGLSSSNNFENNDTNTMINNNNHVYSDMKRSITTDTLQLKYGDTYGRKLYYFPSTQDVLDALKRCSHDKESFV